MKVENLIPLQHLPLALQATERHPWAVHRPFYILANELQGTELIPSGKDFFDGRGDSLVAQLIKHRKSYAPQECAHCGRIWYGPYCEHKDHHLVPEGLILCVFCWAALDDYILREHMEYHHAFREVTEEEQRAVTSACLSWVHDPTKKPLPKKEAKRFDPSVPKWMRSAVKQGMVKPNSNIAYRIESRDQVAISASIVSESKSAEDSA